MKEYEKIEEEAIKKLRPEKPKMKISGKGAFLLEKLSKDQSNIVPNASDKKNEKKISKEY